MDLGTPITPPVEAEDPGLARRARILDAARIAFARAGFHGASMQAICAEAGMSPGALYRYFKSKEAIIEAIADEDRRCAQEILATLSGPGHFTDKLVVAALAYFDEMARPGAAALMLEIFAEGLRNTAVGQRFMETERLVRSAFADAVAQAARDGEIDPDLDHATAIGVMLALGEGIVLRRAIDPDLTLERLAPRLAQTIDGLFQTRPRREPAP